MKRFKKIFTKAVAFSLSAVMVSFSFQTLAAAEGLPDAETGEVLIAEDAIPDEETIVQDEEIAGVEAEEQTSEEDGEGADTEDAGEVTEDTNAEANEDASEENIEDADYDENASEISEDVQTDETQEISEDALSETSEVNIADTDEEELPEIEDITESELTVNGWVGDQYYLDGYLVKDKVIKIGKFYYGFDANGYKYDDTAFVLYYDNDNPSKTYRPWL